MLLFCRCSSTVIPKGTGSMSQSWASDSGKIYSGYLNFFFFDDKKFSIRVEFCLIFLQFQFWPLFAALTLPTCCFRIKGAAWLLLRLLLPAPISRTSLATSLCTPSTRPAVCSPSFLSDASRCCTPRLPPAPTRAPLQRRVQRAARASAAAAGRDLSRERTPEARTLTLRTAVRRRTFRPA